MPRQIHAIAGAFRCAHVGHVQRRLEAVPVISQCPSGRHVCGVFAPHRFRDSGVFPPHSGRQHAATVPLMHPYRCGLVVESEGCRAMMSRRTKVERDARTAYVLRHRLWMIAWWRCVVRAYPGGVVDVGTAAFMLGVSTQRVRELIRTGRLPSVESFRIRKERTPILVPVDALAGCPTALEGGRPYNIGQFLRDNGVSGRDGPYLNPLGVLTELSTIRPNSDGNSKKIPKPGQKATQRVTTYRWESTYSNGTHDSSPQ